MKETRLYRIKCTGPNIPDKVEYLMAESKEIIHTACKQTSLITISEYYGYTKFIVEEVDGFPEISQIELDVPTSVKYMENQIASHSKSIRELKIQIHEERGDYDNTQKFHWSHVCMKHDNCHIYRKNNSPKIVHRKINPLQHYDITLASTIVPVEPLVYHPTCAKTPVNPMQVIGNGSYKCTICNKFHLTKKAVKRISKT